tara:strand:- start:2898 stop:3089 length:192 start_codon:yes stop_codon:yes gene_type:complete
MTEHNEATVNKWLDQAVKYEALAVAGDESKWRPAALAFKKAMSDDGTPMSQQEMDEFQMSLGA